MKRAAIVAGAVGAVACAFACGVITVPPDPTAPANTCTDNASCGARYVDASIAPLCFPPNGSCIEPSAFHPILVVGVPEGPNSQLHGFAGATFGLPDTYQSVRSKNAPLCNETGAFECDFLPPLTEITPSLDIRISKDFGVKLWPPGLRPNQPDPQLPALPLPTSLPVHGVFRPLWIDPATGAPMLAQRLGLPLDDRVMTVTPAFKTSGGTALVGPTTLVATQPGFRLAGTVPQPLGPTDPSGKYQIDVVPDDPFDVFPPWVSLGNGHLDVTPGAVTLASQTFDLSNVIPVFTETPQFGDPQVLFSNDYEVDELPGAPSLAGWKMHIDLGDGRAPTGVDDDAVRISGTVTLAAGATKNVTLWSATGTADQTNQTLFIDPPPGVDLPRYFVQELSGIIVGPKFPYPALPSPAAVKGFVNRADTLKPVSARVVFFANGDQTAAVLEADGTTLATTLLYEKETRTMPADDAGDAGEISVTLPPGNLRAYVVPDDDDLALTVEPFIVAAASVVQNKTLFVNPRPHVRGRVLLADGTPVYGADVVIDASADDPFSSSDDPLMRPRETRGSTDVGGHFDVPSDPGFVDISIRPHYATNFPWLVLAHRSVLPNVPGDAGATGGLELGDVAVPLPTPFVQSTPTGLLTDVVGNALPHTTVRAYAFPPAGALDAGTSPTRGARLIGSTVTDADGVFQLFVTPPQ